MWHRMACFSPHVGREGARSTILTNSLPRIELFKVHGSINRFTMDGRQVECDLWTEGAPDGVERDVAVPGDLKYEQYAVSNMDTVLACQTRAGGCPGVRGDRVRVSMIPIST